MKRSSKRLVIERELHAKLKALAAARDMKMEQLGNDLLRKALKQEEVAK